VILSMATGLAHGVRRSYWAIVGLEIGLMAQLALVAVGLGAALANSVPAFNVIKWIGVGYLVYLAIRQWRRGCTWSSRRNRRRWWPRRRRSG
jgi:homoserine/homoserine lactone efflux protein